MKRVTLRTALSRLFVAIAVCLVLQTKMTSDATAALVRSARLPAQRNIIAGGQIVNAKFDGPQWSPRGGFVEQTGVNFAILSGFGVKRGDFEIHARLRMMNQAGSAAAFAVGDGFFGFEGGAGQVFVTGGIFGSSTTSLGPSSSFFQSESWIDFDVVRTDGKIEFFIDGNSVYLVPGRHEMEFGRIGFLPWRSTMQISDYSITGDSFEFPGEDTRQDVFISGQGGYHTFRIPSLITTQSGVLLAFCEGRKISSRDKSPTDMVLKRSEDGGRTWGPLQVVVPGGPNAMMDPCPVVDQSTGAILLVYDRWPAGWSGATGLGLNSATAWVTISFDDGASWSLPANITSTTKFPDAGHLAHGPGRGIQLESGPLAGRMLIPCTTKINGQWGDYVAYTDDHGQTWSMGGLTGSSINEPSIVELADGDLLINARSNRGANRRAQVKSSDMGESWGGIWDVSDLPEPVCQGSMVRYSREGPQDRNRLLFSNPAFGRSGWANRVNGKVRVSYDEGDSWTQGRTVEPGAYNYSCLTVLSDMTIGVLYEVTDFAGSTGIKTISFRRFSLDSLTDGIEPAPSEDIVYEGRINRNYVDLHAYYDGSEGVETDSLTGVITRWNNLAEGSSAAQRDLGNIFGTPALSTNTIRQSDAVVFDGSSALWATRSEFGQLPQPNTFCFVSRVFQSSSDYMFDSSTGAARNALQVAPSNNPGNWSPYAGVDLSSPVPVLLDEYQAHTLILKPGDVKHFINGALAYTGDAGDQALWGLILGGRYTGANNLVGEVTEFIVYDEAISEPDRSEIDRYFALRYGLPIAGVCYADCDRSTGAGVLDLFDFLCFQSSFVNGESYACDCDTTTGAGRCDVFDFLCFQSAFVSGCA